MAFPAPVHFSSPVALALAACAAALAVAVILLRKPALPRLSKIFALAGALFLTFAAGAPIWQAPSPQDVAVMVDLSPSTRTASYRRRPFLEQRIHELLGATPYHVVFFADSNRPDDGSGPVLADMPADRTVFAPPPAAGILLFSDARFELPGAAPPTYPVVDPELDHVHDAAVQNLTLRGDDLIVTIANSGEPRNLTLEPTDSATKRAIERGSVVLTAPIKEGAGAASARLDPGDAWPENDQAAIAVLPPAQGQRWWVGAAPPGVPWKSFAPQDMPTDGAQYLLPAVIVLNDISADRLQPAVQAALDRYVNDWGGALVIVGGDAAFAAGGYPGSILETLSPLSSSPPTPTTHWLMLVDSSGSMAEPAGNDPRVSRWAVASAALVKLLPQLPPADPVSVGNFSSALNWWSTGRSARDTAGLALPPPQAAPGGPTNLEPVLDRLADDAEPALSKQIVLLTDAQAIINHPADLGAKLVAKNIHLDLLVIGPDDAPAELRQIITATGGVEAREAEASQWLAVAEKLVRQVAGDRLIHAAVELRSIARPHLPAQSVETWNRTWLKEHATALATARYHDEDVPMIGRRQSGNGRVIAAAFAADQSAAIALAESIARSPRDSSVRVTWQAGSELRVSIDAADRAEKQPYLNGARFTLELAAQGPTSAAPQTWDVPQTAPGHYELGVPAPRQPAFATLSGQGRVVDRIAVAGRFAPEFDAVGNDHNAMDQLARNTGGVVIDSRDNTPIDFHWPTRQVPLTALLAVLGAALVAGALLYWKTK